MGWTYSAYTSDAEARFHLGDQDLLTQSRDQPLPVLREEDRSAGVDWPE